ncbi:hypothetical protein SAMN05444396_10873 [Flavobacterium segetis]|uniref:Uncharacterized protein n=1 Tax=Flavobacterium segetis TaxID=271157 RepID=A0A1M5IU93_9FLAO|nr:hypothetical protein [Flavobacterium segetis]SHG31918.1 hypothetical protein SAMN05444396_10873 [Flavobacterium segetis]
MEFGLDPSFKIISLFNGFSFKKSSSLPLIFFLVSSSLSSLSSSDFGSSDDFVFSTSGIANNSSPPFSEKFSIASFLILLFIPTPSLANKYLVENLREFL